LDLYLSDLGGEKVSEKQAQKIKEKEIKWNNFKKIENKMEKVIFFLIKISILKISFSGSKL